MSRVKEWYVLSPLLLALFLVYLAKRLEEAGTLVDMDGERIPALFYADDVVTVNPNASGLVYRLF